MSRAEIGRLEGQLAVLERLIGEGDAALARRADRVSAWSVGEQIDHMLKVLDASLGRLGGAGETFEGMIDLITMKAIYFDGENGEKVRTEAPPAKYEALIATHPM